MIQPENITKRYGTKTAIQNVSFAMEGTEVLGIFGPNGAGKTTLARLLAGCALPSQGRVSVCGYDTAKHGLEVRRRVGYLPQRAALYTDMTVEKFLAYAARLHHVENCHQRVQECLALFHLADHAKVLIDDLSYFQRQQICIAHTLLHEPSVLILDEPTAGLGPEQIVGLHRSIKAFLGSYTIILTTQIWSEVEEFCDHALVLSEGCVIDESDFSHVARQLIH